MFDALSTLAFGNYPHDLSTPAICLSPMYSFEDTIEVPKSSKQLLASQLYLAYATLPYITVIDPKIPLLRYRHGRHHLQSPAWHTLGNIARVSLYTNFITTVWLHFPSSNGTCC
jgi:hypothetical protein